MVIEPKRLYQKTVGFADFLFGSAPVELPSAGAELPALLPQQPYQVRLTADVLPKLRIA